MTVVFGDRTRFVAGWHFGEGQGLPMEGTSHISSRNALTGALCEWCVLRVLAAVASSYA
jgi:hypothetical protein